MAESTDARESDLHEASPAYSSNRIGPGNLLPAPRTSFVGREEAAAHIAARLLQPDVPLITLTGPGGVGKTRLALHLANTVAGTYTDGVVFVDLSPLTDPNLVAPTIARSLGILEEAGTQVSRQLQDFLESRDLLLVLDNFEHVVEAAPLVASLLHSTRITVLVTSREPLRVSAERIIEIPPLSLPVESSTLDQLAQIAAVNLFVDRAQAARFDFQLTEANAPVVSKIVSRLDGLPLAIELAAARMSHLAPETLLARLDHRLPLLTRGTRDLPARQRTLRDAIAWSVDLLGTSDQQLFARLAVFVDGWTLDSAEAICQSAGAAPQDVLDALASLTARSLVRLEWTATGHPRYRMLETIREYALECLEASGEVEALRQAHASWFLELAERNEFAELLTHGGQDPVHLDIEIANLRAALAWFQKTGEIGAQLRLAAAMRHQWADLGYYQEGRHWLLPARLDGSIVPADRAGALVTLGIIDIYLGLHQEAENCLTAGLDHFRGQADALNITRTLIGLGALATHSGDWSGGISHLEECLAIANSIVDQRLAQIMGGWALINLAVISRAQGNIPQGETLLIDAADRMRRAQYTPGLVMALSDNGDLARDLADYVRSLGMYREALTLGLENPRFPALTFAVEGIASVAIAMGQPEHGVRLLGVAASMRDRIGLRYRVVENRLAHESDLARARSTLDEETYAAAWSVGRDLRQEQAIPAALVPFESAPASPGPPLTPREQVVLQLLAAGQTNQAIAGTLFISVRTAENHVAHVLAKFGVSSRTDAVNAAIAAGLLAPDPAGTT